jgi:hypothetical protein
MDRDQKYVDGKLLLGMLDKEKTNVSCRE